MRIPDIAFFDTFNKYDKIKEKDLQRFTQELASGKKILKPSDNTVDSVRTLRLKNLSDDLEVYSRNMSMVRSTLDIAESTLGSIVDTGQETRVEIIRLLNTGVLDSEDAEVLRDFFQSMRDYIVNQANVQVGDTSLFGGVKSQVNPIASDGSYQGETVETTVPVSKGVELNTTFNGKNYLGVNENSNKMAMVEAIDKIIEIIDSGDLTRLHSEKINVTVNGEAYGNISILEAFDKGLDAVMQYRSKIGSQINVIDNLKQQNETIKVNYNELISALEDTDYAGTISNLEKARTAYEALLASISQNKDISLLNFMK